MGRILSLMLRETFSMHISGEKLCSDAHVSYTYAPLRCSFFIPNCTIENVSGSRATFATNSGITSRNKR